MNLTKHKKWISDYLKRNYGWTPVRASNIEVDNDCNLVVESWDSRMNIWRDQVPFMRKDKFCKMAKLDSDRDGSYCHYKFSFPFDYVDSMVNPKGEAPNSNKNYWIIPDEFGDLGKDLFRGVGEVKIGDYRDCTPHEILKNCMSDVKDYWLKGCGECEYEDESLVQCQKAAMVLLYALMKHDDRVI